MFNFLNNQNSFTFSKKNYFYPFKTKKISNFESTKKILIFSLNSIFPIISILIPNNNLRNKIIFNYFKNNNYILLKMGQILSSRPEIKKYFDNILDDLQNKACSHKFEESIHILKKDNFPLNEYEFVKNEPEFSGSVAQVYKIKKKVENKNSIFNLFFGKNDKNKFYALKIVHPKIQEKISEDFQILESIHSRFEKIFYYFNCFDFKNQINTLKIDILKQVNLRNESLNMKIFKFLNTFKNIKIPRVYFESKNVILMEYLAAENNKNLIQENEKQKNNLKLSNILSKYFLKSLFNDNIIHLDLHPGNITFQKENIILYDFGLVKYFTENERKNFIDLIIAIFRKDNKEIAKLLVERHPINKKNLNKESQNFIDLNKFMKESEKCLEKLSLENFQSFYNFRENLKLFFDICNKNNVKFDTKYNQIFMSYFCLDGILRKLDPKLEFYKNSKKIVFYGPIFKMTIAYFKNLIT